ncbi:MAG: hypothetical protein GX248_07390 [Peptococcaceae bacterium]|jgi:TM2 domain-containing membrane protein YozV|nr:hypothetical protein [Peptococcaceae bacterium]
MRKKSKFLTFILSFVPGLGHIYLGLIQRGLLFLVATALVVLSAFFIGILGVFYGPLPLVFFPFIWLAALVDSIILADRINRQMLEAKPAGTEYVPASNMLEDELKMQNHKILAVIFSMIPGAGHMYLGQMIKGIQLMAAFLLALYLSDFLNLSLLMMFLPLLWFYSVFDVLHRVSNADKFQDSASLKSYFPAGELSGKAGKYIGIGLVVIGCLMILERIVLPQLQIMLDARFADYLRTGIIAILFIAGGIRLMMGNKDRDSSKDQEHKNIEDKNKEDNDNDSVKGDS